MRLATLRTGDGTIAARIESANDGDVAVPLAFSEVGELLRQTDRRKAAEREAGRPFRLEESSYAPVISAPEKIICAGLNYRSHILELGRDLPEHPTLFAKYHRALIGATDAICVPAAASEPDWEAELAVIIGSEVRAVSPDEAVAAIAGYAVLNDVTMRDWQWRTDQWLQGKTWESTTPLGPWLVTPDDADPAGSGRPDLELACTINDYEVQRAQTGDLLFGPAELIAYISTVVTLVPGDVIATGTPGGIGAARDPKRFLHPNETVRTTIEQLGTCTNVVQVC